MSRKQVNLAAQTFSSSVADAIEYCSSVLKLKQFQVSEATVKFIRIINHLFDVLNSKNPRARCFKSAIHVTNKMTWEPFFNDAYSYIFALTDPPGKPMYCTHEKLGSLGFWLP